MSEGIDNSEYSIDELTEADVEESEEVKYAVRLTDVSRVYSIGDRTITALQHVDLTVRPGEFVVVNGPSGSGKTTLLNVIGAIDYPTEGRVVLMDVPIGDYDESFRATFRLTYTGFIFQSYNLISTLTALENVMFPMQLSDDPLAEIRARALALLERVGLAERRDHLPWQLSSGEQQRVAIA
ncbi:MAG: ABC transporter ATP-binding protein [Candidatus Thorarchaeota archaeon]